MQRHREQFETEQTCHHPGLVINLKVALNEEFDNWGGGTVSFSHSPLC